MSCPLQECFLELSIVDVLPTRFSFYPAHNIKSKVLFCLCSLYKNNIFWSNLAQLTLAIFGFCSKIVFKKSRQDVAVSPVFSSSKRFSFSAQKYFSILCPLLFLYSSISFRDKWPKGRDNIPLGKCIIP